MAEYLEKIKHLKKDKVLAKVIGRTGEISLKKNNNLYLALMRAIVGQQLSVKAANTIWKRFLNLFTTRYPSRDELLLLTDEQLRGAGLSYQKAGYIRNIATFAAGQGLDFSRLKKKTDDELIEYLVQVKGVGRWTVEMILMFNLQREDIFPKDDLGIQTGIRSLYGCSTDNKKKFFAEMEHIAEKWRPYRTLACMYLWRHKDSLVSEKKT
jgi:DNA-3-methyladenine glycosylase II